MIIESGAVFEIRAVKDARGRVPALDFIKALGKQDLAKVKNLLQWFAKRGPIEDARKFKPLGQGLVEFKCFQIRIGAFYGKGRILFLTHGFIKKKDNWPDEEIRKARELKRHHEENHG